MHDFNLNNNPMTSKLNTSLLVVGIGIILLGCLLILENLLPNKFAFELIRFWPAILIALGVVKMVESKFRGVGGWVITILGTLLLLQNVSRFSFEDLIGPAILITVGILVVLHALKRHRRVPPELQKSRSFARGNAILSTISHKPRGEEFNGGEITAIFGGFDLDLRQAAMKHDSVRLDIFVMFGGGEIRVPEEWEVFVQTSAIAGAVENKRTDLPVADAQRPKLLITGNVLFGGVDVK